jgi:hypothetical protein
MGKKKERRNIILSKGIFITLLLRVFGIIQFNTREKLLNENIIINKSKTCMHKNVCTTQI